MTGEKRGHKPLPWHRGFEGNQRIYGSDGGTIGEIYSYRDLDFILRAANTHPALVEALERLVAEEDRYVRDAGVTLDDPISEAVEKAREVVRAAKGGQHAE